MLIFFSWALASFPECPDQANGCPGTALERSTRAVAAARDVDLNAPWTEVRSAGKHTGLKPLTPAPTVP